MKNKIRRKIVASVLLSAFMVTNSMTASFAMEDYYGYGAPAIRTGEQSAVGLSSTYKISNGDSVVNLSLRDADIKQVLRMFADQAGMNIIFASDVEGEVTMDLVDIPLSDALDLVVKTNNLYYDIKANTLVFSTTDSSLNLADRGKNLTIIPVKYVNALALSSFLNKSIFSPKGKGSVRPGMSNGFIVATNPATNELIVTGTENDLAVVRNIVEKFDRKPTITTFKVNHTTPAEMAASICTSLFPSMSIVDGNGGSSGGAAGIPTGFASDSSDSGSSGGGSGSISVGGGKVACALSTQQMTSESTNDEDTFQLDSLPLMNLSVSYFPTQGTIQVIGGSDTQIDMIREYIALNDKKTPQAYLEVQIVSLSESGSKTFDNTWQFLSKNFSFNAGGGQGFATNSMYPIFWAGRGYTLVDPESFDSETGTYEAVGKVGKWSTSPQLVYSVNYLVENQKGRVLANPRILLTSGQSSTIDLTSDYVSKVTSQYLDSGSASGSAQVQKDYEIKDDNGIKVEITPFISPDGYVTLDIKPEYKTIASQIYGTGESGERELQATLLQRRDLDLKGVRIKDGETLVIGGMIQESETKSVNKIPFLGDIPVLGMFFRSTGTSKSKEEMVIMLTPQIVIDTEDAVADDNLL
ncbi:hypothetical protein IJ541_09275 [bacterium]|nr:hypothetical protein [bacterium]